jgi:hypothetical protein
MFGPAYLAWQGRRDDLVSSIDTHGHRRRLPVRPT